MHAAIAELVPVLGFEVEFVDIDADPWLKQRYDILVPVLAGGERILCTHFLDLAALEGFLGATGTETQ